MEHRSQWVTKFHLGEEIKNTKAALKDWVNQSLKSPTSNRKKVLEKLEEFQLEMEETEITSTCWKNNKKPSLTLFERLGRKKNFGD